MSGTWRPSAAALRNLPSRDSTRRNIRSCQNFEQQSDLVLKQGVLKSMIDQNAVCHRDHRLQAGAHRFAVRRQGLLRHPWFRVDGYRLALRREPIVSDLTTPLYCAGQDAGGDLQAAQRGGRGGLSCAVAEAHRLPHRRLLRCSPACWRANSSTYNAAIPEGQQDNG